MEILRPSTSADGDTVRETFMYDDNDSPDMMTVRGRPQHPLLSSHDHILKMPTRTLHGSAFYGWLWKKGASFKTWKKRFFLLNGSTLTYYTQSCIVESAKYGTRCLEIAAKGGMRVGTASFTNKTTFGILIKSSSGRELYVQAGNDTTRQQWLRALQDAACKRGTSIPGYNDSTATYFNNSTDSIDYTLTSESVQSSMSSDEEEVGRTDMQGWLHVKSTLGFKKKFVTLIDGMMVLTSNERSRRPTDITMEVLSVTNWTGHQYGLMIQLEQHKDLFVYANSDQEVDMWITAFKNGL